MGEPPFIWRREMPIHTSKTVHEYPYGHVRQVGDRFDVEPGDVHILLALGRIEPEGDGTAAYSTRDMASQPAATYSNSAMEAQPRQKRTYTRRAA